MDPLSLGIITAVVGALATVAAKKWIFPFFESSFKFIKNFFSKEKSEDNLDLEQKKIEETPKKEVEEKDETKSIKTNKVIKNSESKNDTNLKIDNHSSKTDISVKEATEKERAYIHKATNDLIAIKNKLHNGTAPSASEGRHLDNGAAPSATEKHPLPNHPIVGSHTKHAVLKEHHIHPHENFLNNKKNNEEADEETGGR